MMDEPTTLNKDKQLINLRFQGKNLRHRVGLVYVPGALPCFETFGNLPTDLIRGDALVDGKPASEILEMLIIPGGSLVESQAITSQIEREILNMAENGKLVLGICSGFQILSKGTDIGRLSPVPIWRKGLGLLDVEFNPLICTDQVKATVIGISNLTEAIGGELSGFHCHTYGNMKLGKDANPILVSHVKRLNYGKQMQDLISGVSNSKGNVIGLLPHAILDRNPLIIEGITKTLDIESEELKEIRVQNAKLQSEMKTEMGISTKTHSQNIDNKKKSPRSLLITALESGGGKTFVTTGLAGALRRKGWKVGVIKVGGDVRDIVPALYLLKEPMQDYSSIIVAETGWKRPNESMKGASRDYNFILVEGAMNAFTGLLYDQPRRPNSTAEVAAALGIPTVIVAGCDKEGIEGGIVSALNYVHFLKKLRIKTVGVILNKVYLDYMSEETGFIVKKAFAEAGAELLGIVPVSDVEGRGSIPEVEIKYEEFGSKALEVAENCLNLERIIELSTKFEATDFDYEAFVEKFKKSLSANN
jgi:cobyric acid synthase